MLELGLRKIPFSEEAENRLRMLKARTGLDRNYICRMGFCLSLDEPGIPVSLGQAVKSVREIDRYTLLGQNALAFLALLLVWMQEKRLSMKSDVLDGMFIAHMNRGVEIMASRVRSLVDIATLLTGATLPVARRRSKGQAGRV